MDTPLDTFMVVCTFKDDTVMDEVFAVIAEEQAQVELLKAEGRVGSIHLALARNTVFIETFAESLAGAIATVGTLPMARWWNIDAFPTASAPAPRSAA